MAVESLNNPSLRDAIIPNKLRKTDTSPVVMTTRNLPRITLSRFTGATRRVSNVPRSFSPAMRSTAVYEHPPISIIIRINGRILPMRCPLRASTVAISIRSTSKGKDISVPSPRNISAYQLTRFLLNMLFISRNAGPDFLSALLNITQTSVRPDSWFFMISRPICAFPAATGISGRVLRIYRIG